MKHKILLVDDDADLILFPFEMMFQKNGYEIDLAENGHKAIELVKKDPNAYSVIILDYGMPGLNGAETAQILLKINEDLIILMLTGKGNDLESISSMLKSNPIHILQKGMPNEILLEYVHSYCIKFDEEVRRVSVSKTPDINEKIINGVGMIGRSQELVDAIDLIKKLSPGESTVLVTGENGVGKELAAKAIHQFSGRGDKKLISINCSALSSTLLESELFGHKKDSFTGAFTDRKGLFVAAQGGTLFLDEIGEMSMDLQAKLLRALQEKSIKPIGSESSITVDVKIICATNANLKEMIKNKQFRTDLFYRIQGLTINIPPLRKRIDDIEPLVASFSENSGKKFLSKTVKKMQRYSWPGNIRELKSEVERIIKLTSGEKIEPIHLDSKYFDNKVNWSDPENNDPNKIQTWKEFEAQQEIEMMRYMDDVVKKSGGVLKIAAQRYFKHNDATLSRIRKHLGEKYGNSYEG